jgi:undecaprenyl-diphosphatase
MDLILLGKAVMLGVVEGLTEFLPISSTGHLILVGDLLDFNDERGKAFEVIIQFGAILAVCWEFRKKLCKVASTIQTSTASRRFVLNLLIASVPAMGLAFIFGKHIKAVLFSPIPVASAFIVGALVIFWAEKRQQTVVLSKNHIQSVDDLTPLDALKVGLAQCAALIPGTSRSGATIIGGMLFGLPRAVATEFSFFLAIPVIGGATAYELLKLWKNPVTLSDEFTLSQLLCEPNNVWILCIHKTCKYDKKHGKPFPEQITYFVKFPENMPDIKKSIQDAKINFIDKKMK